MNKKGSRIPISRVLSRSVSTSEPVICLVPGSPRGSSVLPSIALLGRATLSRWYTRTCSSQRTQPDDHPPAGGLLHHLLTLAFPGKAVVFFCLSLPSPTASIFRSGMPYAARTFLPHSSCQRQAGVLLPWCKVTKNREQDTILSLSGQNHQNLFFYAISIQLCRKKKKKKCGFIIFPNSKVNK